MYATDIKRTISITIRMHCRNLQENSSFTIWRGGSNPIFPQDTPKFGFGDGEKSIWKERGKVFVLTNC